MTMIQPTEIRFTQADYLRKAREIAGLTQQQLADEIGIDRASVVKYEKVGTPKQYILRDWAEVTGVSLKQLSQPGLRDYKATISDTLLHPMRIARKSRPSNRRGNTGPKGRA